MPLREPGMSARYRTNPVLRDSQDTTADGANLAFTIASAKTRANITAQPGLAEDVFDLLDDPATSTITPAIKTSLGGTSSG